MKENKEVREININQVVRYLNHAFSKATSGLDKAVRYVDYNINKVKTTELYDLQVDFMYMLDEIQRGPKYALSRVISDCNKLIDNINK